MCQLKCQFHVGKNMIRKYLYNYIYCAKERIIKFHYITSMKKLNYDTRSYRTPVPLMAIIYGYKKKIPSITQL